MIDANIILFGGSDYNTVDNFPPTIPIHCDSFWTLQHSKIKNEYTKAWVTDGLRESTLKAVCDGSYKPKLTSKGIIAAFVIEGRNNNSQIIGTIATSGITSDPYREELLGIYATLSAVSYIERYNQAFTTGKLRIGCANEKAGWIFSISTPIVATQAKHFDVVKAIRRLSLTLTTIVEFYHLYGHQDKYTLVSLLSRDTQLNILVDDIA